MRARFGFVLMFLVCGFLCGQARSADDKLIEPTAQIRIRSLRDAMKDLKELAHVVGQESIATDLQAQIKHRLPNGFEGIDPKKPIFLYAGISPIGQTPFGVALVPVSNGESFIKLIEQIAQFKATREGDVYFFSLPTFPSPVYVRIKDGYACISPTKPPLEDGQLLLPARFSRTPVSESASLQIRFDRLPGLLKQVIRSQYESLAKEARSQKVAGESATGRALRLAMVEGAVQFVTRLLEDGEELNLEIDLGKQREKAKVKLSLRAKPNTLLRSYIARMGDSESLFAGWVMSPSPVVQFAFHGKLPEQGRKIFDAIVQYAIVQPLEESGPGKGRKVYDALRPTIEAGELDVACSWRGPTAKGQYKQAMGFRILEADKLEQIVKENQEALPARIKFGVARCGSYEIHSARMKTQDLEENLFGDGIVYFAFRKDALLLVHGDGLAELKNALLANPRKARPFEGEIKLGKALESFKDSFRRLEDILKEKFQKPGADSARVTLEGGGELRLNVDIGIPLLEYMMKDAQRSR
jgi:hypothetical protein